MLYKLPFPAGDNRRFKIVHQCLVLSPEEMRREDLKIHGELLISVQAIGVPDARMAEILDDKDADPVVLYNLRPEGGELIMEEGQYQLLKRYFRSTIKVYPKMWSADVAKFDEVLKSLKGYTIQQVKDGTEPEGPALVE